MYWLISDEETPLNKERIYKNSPVNISRIIEIDIDDSDTFKIYFYSDNHNVEWRFKEKNKRDQILDEIFEDVDHLHI